MEAEKTNPLNTVKQEERVDDVAEPNVPVLSTEKKDVESKKKWPLIPILVACVAVVAFLIWGGVSVAHHQQEAAKVHAAAQAHALILTKAFKGCQYDKGQEEDFTLGDGGKSLSYSSGDDGVVRGFTCITDSVKMPQSTLSKISNTSGLSGTQTDEWNGIKITWSYNANVGLDAVFELTK